MDTKKVLIIIAGAVVLIVGGSFVIRSFRESNKVQTPPKPSLVETATTPTPTPNSIPASVQTTAVRGTIVAVDSSELTVKFQDTLQIFSITGAKDIQRITSGTIEKGDTKTIPVSTNDLKIGQEVLVIHNIGSTNARSVYIIK